MVILGLQQRLFSKFRITTNGGQCISWKLYNASSEMGIDVRSYAQKRGKHCVLFCVGCGICAAVCPRGVLKLENGSEEGRIN
jgi:ferredoxin